MSGISDGDESGQCDTPPFVCKVGGQLDARGEQHCVICGSPKPSATSPHLDGADQVTAIESPAVIEVAERPVVMRSAMDRQILSPDEVEAEFDMHLGDAEGYQAQMREEAEAELIAIREEDELRDLEHYEEWQRDQALEVQRDHAARHECLTGEEADVEGLGDSSAAEATDRSTIHKTPPRKTTRASKSPLRPGHTSSSLTRRHGSRGEVATLLGDGSTPNAHQGRSSAEGHPCVVSVEDGLRDDGDDGTLPGQDQLQQLP
eukprot:9475569-Pyramimonas_sp.AAC.1